MLLLERIPVEPAIPVSTALIAEHMRIDASATTAALPYVSAAAQEIEEYADLAILDQTIKAISEHFPHSVIRLPIGPVADGAVVTVARLEGDGSTTEITEGFTLTPGRFPFLTFDTAPLGRLIVTYPAGFGSDDADVPPDLQLAIVDQALRLYDQRGDVDARPTLSPAAARIAARYRRVAIDA